MNGKCVNIGGFDSPKMMDRAPGSGPGGKGDSNLPPLENSKGAMPRTAGSGPSAKGGSVLPPMSKVTAMPRNG
jgi:hypothetical protein